MFKVKIKAKDVLLAIGTILGYIVIIAGVTMTIFIFSWLFYN